VEAMIMKLDFWSEDLQKCMLELFPTLSDFLTASDGDLSQEINLITQNLQSLKNSFEDVSSSDAWIRV
jgi:hypothetical protein